MRTALVPNLFSTIPASLFNFEFWAALPSELGEPNPLARCHLCIIIAHLRRPDSAWGTENGSTLRLPNQEAVVGNSQAEAGEMNEAEASGYLLMAGGLVWVMVGIIGCS